MEASWMVGESRWSWPRPEAVLAEAAAVARAGVEAGAAAGAVPDDRSTGAGPDSSTGPAPSPRFDIALRRPQPGIFPQIVPYCVFDLASYLTLIVTTADIPALSVCGLPNSFGSSRIFTGTRWTTLTQFPVAFSGGKREKRAPVPALIESTTPWSVLFENVSISTRAGIPGRTRASCVSLKLAITHTSRSGTIAS